MRWIATDPMRFGSRSTMYRAFVLDTIANNDKFCHSRGRWGTKAGLHRTMEAARACAEKKAEELNHYLPASTLG